MDTALMLIWVLGVLFIWQFLYRNYNKWFGAFVIFIWSFVPALLAGINVEILAVFIIITLLLLVKETWETVGRITI